MRRAIGVLQSASGKPLKLVDTQDWLSTAEKTSTSATTPSARVLPEIFAWISAVAPPTSSGRQPVAATTFVEVSCLQLQDRLRRAIVSGDLARTYHYLLDEVRSPNLDEMDKVLTALIAGRKPSARPSTLLGLPASGHSAVAKRNVGTESGLHSWIIKTPSLAFLSALLYAILGTA